ncbi:MAG: hypothetical protein JSS86_18510 [Cyanobacteria bacterium SZAS LIN-2]|nr:hypothetical protein [Cyanobacteria bacterium SZAS LIN-3]MBS1998326.1 hypothetical protein [Cyanobacteria bacterium SZAS LIN-2]
MRKLILYISLLALALPLMTEAGPAAAQSSSSESQSGHHAPAVVPLPPARRGQPAWSFSGGKRVSSQTVDQAGMHEYSGPPGTGPAGTGIQEIGGSGGSVPSAANNPVKLVPLVKNADKAAGEKFLTGSKQGQAPQRPKGAATPATTVVQLLGPDGKMQYKEVPFMGELSANKRAPNITEVKDGEGKVKEYEWVKKAH